MVSVQVRIQMLLQEEGLEKEAYSKNRGPFPSRQSPQKLSIPQLGEDGVAKANALRDCAEGSCISHPLRSFAWGTAS